MKIYFTEKLAAIIIDDYQNLIGQKIPTQLGKLTINRVIAIEVCKGEFDILLQTNTDHLEFREIYEVMDITQIRLLDYLPIKGLEFNPRRYGALLGKFTSEKDENCIDLFL